MPARRLRAVALASLTLAPLLVAVPALAATNAEISASAPLVGHDAVVTLTVSLSGDPGCLGGRDVTLEWSQGDAGAFSPVGSGVTSAEGSAAMAQAQVYSGSYRASIEATSGCPALASGEVPVQVRARVDASVALGDGVAGSCVTFVTSVQPARPGQLVDLQRRQAGSWETIERLPLGPDSSVLSSPCFGFDDIGKVRLRARWIAQDELNATGTSPRVAFRIEPAPWMREIDDAIGARSVSVAVGEEDEYLFRHHDAAPRIPASTTKLLLSMAMLDRLPTGMRIRTSAAARSIDTAGVVEDLWLLGRGDPRVSQATLASLARRLVDAGLSRVRGRVIGSKGYFDRDWDAPGWNDVARDYVNRPTALTFGGNEVHAPELKAAKVLTKQLETMGVRVVGRARSGVPTSEPDAVSFVRSRPLIVLLERMLRPSDNFAAEVLGKRLGVEAAGVPGTISKGADAIEGFAEGHGADFTINDGSGLSYANRVTAEGFVRLLWVAEDARWFEDLREALPTGGQGTLRSRLHGVQVRAKTGSLSEVSALAGWVYSEEASAWIEFAIFSSGMAKATASAIEDRIVRILAQQLA